MADRNGCKAPPLFEDDAKAQDALDPRAFASIATLWDKCHRYADKGFIRDVQSSVDELRAHPKCSDEWDRAFLRFHRRWWEVCVASTLLNQGVELAPRSSWAGKAGAGPDLLATVAGRRVWIECVAPMEGTGLDRVPRPSERPDYLPSDEIKLRFLQALDEKRQQHARHVEAGVVQQCDGYVVALNSRCISMHTRDDDEPPWIAQALYGLGPLAVRFDRTTNEWSDPWLTREFAVTKASGTPIGANLFGSGEAPQIGGVLYSSADAWTGGDFNLEMAFIHNWKAGAPLPHRWLPRSPSYSVTAQGNIGEVTRQDPE